MTCNRTIPTRPKTSIREASNLNAFGPIRAPQSIRERKRKRLSAYQSIFRILFLSIFLAACLHRQSFAQSTAGTDILTVQFGARKIFFMLFLMIGPIKVLVPFLAITRNWPPAYRRRLATRAIFFSVAALAIAGLLGRSMLENFEISLPVLAMTAGIILFLVALRSILQPAVAPDQPPEIEQAPNLALAINPLAFPTIVTPYGIAAVIVFSTFAGSRQGEGLTVAVIVALILALDWVAMIFAPTILKWTGTALQVLAVVLGVTQAALGLQIIFRSITMIAL
ncbi:hypothetical protein CO654_02270 [Rhizobium sp. L18]|uniref:MarC family protein n=1 Tax=Rhizobium sp. 969_B3_N1_2 TaxID=3276278 RepID=UPI000BE9F99C|nr:hypothetical protein CO654_02270 [Rhizobium sp. L18]